jgi:hypothetical protein
LYAATCRHCGRAILQHPSGVWIPRDGSLRSDPNGIYCQKSGRRPHEPMPSGLAGAPRWLSPETSHGADAVSASQDSGRAWRPHEAVWMRVRHAVVRLKEIARFRMAWW